MPEVAEMEPKVISAGFVRFGQGFRALVLRMRPSQRGRLPEESLSALAGVWAEEMVLFTPS